MSVVKCRCDRVIYVLFLSQKVRENVFLRTRNLGDFVEFDVSPSVTSPSFITKNTEKLEWFSLIVMAA